MRLTSEIEQALLAESARWGDYRRTTPYTVANDFRPLRQQLLDDWFPRRSGIVLDQFRDEGLYPKFHAPVFTPADGSLGENDRLAMSSKSVSVFLPGARILYTVGGSDPRLPGGAVHPQAREYQASIPVTISGWVKARVENQGEWSALQATLFVLDAAPATPANLLISAIHYHPGEPSETERQAGHENDADFEFLELLNPSHQRGRLAGLRLAGGIRFDFQEAGIWHLDPGERLRLAHDSEAYQERYGPDGTDGTAAGPYEGRLANEGETLAILDAEEETILTMRYDDGGDWPVAPDGQGPMLTLKDPRPGLNLSDPASWVARDLNRPRVSPWLTWLAAQANPDPLAPYPGQRFSNLAAYYFAADLRNGSPLIQFDQRDGASLTRRSNLSDTFRMSLEISSDLNTWRPVEGLELTAVASDASTEDLSLRLPRHSHAYLRLRVEWDGLAP